MEERVRAELKKYSQDDLDTTRRWLGVSSEDELVQFIIKNFRSANMDTGSAILSFFQTNQVSSPDLFIKNLIYFSLTDIGFQQQNSGISKFNPNLSVLSNYQFVQKIAAGANGAVMLYKLGNYSLTVKYSLDLENGDDPEWETIVSELMSEFWPLAPVTFSHGYSVLNLDVKTPDPRNPSEQILDIDKLQSIYDRNASFQEKHVQTFVILQELVDGISLHKYLDPANTSLNVQDCLVTLLLSVVYLQKNYGFTHYDLHTGNVICRDVPTTVVYMYKNKPFVFNTKRLPTIIDYGRAYIDGIPSSMLKLAKRINALGHIDIHPYESRDYNDLVKVLFYIENGNQSRRFYNNQYSDLLQYLNILPNTQMMRDFGQIPRIAKPSMNSESYLFSKLLPFSSVRWLSTIPADASNVLVFGDTFAFYQFPKGITTEILNGKACPELYGKGILPAGLEIQINIKSPIIRYPNAEFNTDTFEASIPGMTIGKELVLSDQTLIRMKDGIYNEYPTPAVTGPDRKEYWINGFFIYGWDESYPKPSVITRNAVKFMTNGNYVENSIHPSEIINGVKIWKNSEGKVSRTNGPASIFEYGGIKIETWRKDDVVQKRFRWKDNVLIEEFHNSLNKPSEEYPSVVQYFPSGEVKRKEWVDDENVCHRLGGPVIIEYFPNGKVSKEVWAIHGSVNRIKGPALISYYENGNVAKEEWMREDLLHNAEGPAVVEYSPNRQVTLEKFYFKGEEVPSSYADKLAFFRNTYEQSTGLFKNEAAAILFDFYSNDPGLALKLEPELREMYRTSFGKQKQSMIAKWSKVPALKKMMERW